jgi:hypothetical protein
LMRGVTGAPDQDGSDLLATTAHDARDRTYRFY